MMPLIGCQTKTEVDDTPLNQEVVESFWVLGFFYNFFLLVSPLTSLTNGKTDISGWLLLASMVFLEIEATEWCGTEVPMSHPQK